MQCFVILIRYMMGVFPPKIAPKSLDPCYEGSRFSELLQKG